MFSKLLEKPQKSIFFSGPATKGGGVGKGRATEKIIFLRLPSSMHNLLIFYLSGMNHASGPT